MKKHKKSKGFVKDFPRDKESFNKRKNLKEMWIKPKNFEIPMNSEFDIANLRLENWIFPIKTQRKTSIKPVIFFLPKGIILLKKKKINSMINTKEWFQYLKKTTQSIIIFIFFYFVSYFEFC